jgi:2-phosphosulfolactate phosphatase
MSATDRLVTISCFHGQVDGFVAQGHDAIVAVDVIRSTTTATTAVALGRRCIPVPSLASAARIRELLDRPLMAGELGGDTPDGFDITNSPAAVDGRTDTSRPMILLSSSGTKLMCAARGSVYLGCLRNYEAVVNYLAHHHEHAWIIGAGTRGEFREEDILCCAWIAAGLVERGYEPKDAQTQEIIDCWGRRPADAILSGKSAAYLRASGQLDDLKFILDHVNDLDCVVGQVDGELIEVGAGIAWRSVLGGQTDDHR